jgi:hypothetical protein
MFNEISKRLSAAFWEWHAAHHPLFSLLEQPFIFIGHFWNINW